MRKRDTTEEVILEEIKTDSHFIMYQTIVTSSI